MSLSALRWEKMPEKVQKSKLERLKAGRSSGGSERHCSVAIEEMLGINYPYSNSEAPLCSFAYQSMMLEVNKRVYLEKNSVYLKSRSDKKRTVREVIEMMMAKVAPRLSGTPKFSTKFP